MTEAAQTETPRTDTIADRYPASKTWELAQTMSNHARILERELAASQESLRAAQDEIAQARLEEQHHKEYAQEVTASLRAMTAELNNWRRDGTDVVPRLRTQRIAELEKELVDSDAALTSANAVCIAEAERADKAERALEACRLDRDHWKGLWERYISMQTGDVKLLMIDSSRYRLIRRLAEDESLLEKLDKATCRDPKTSEDFDAAVDEVLETLSDAVLSARQAGA